MTGPGERRGGPYGEEPYRDGTTGPEGYDPAATYGTYQQGQGDGYGQGYPPNPGYGTPVPGQDQGQYGYDTPAYENSAYESPAYGTPYGQQQYDPQQYAQAPGRPPAQPQAPGYGYETGYDSGAYAAPQPAQPGYAPPSDYDSGAYAPYDGQTYPASGVRPDAAPQAPGQVPGQPAYGRAQAAAAPAEPQVRRPGSTDPAESSSTTGSYRVQVGGTGTAARPSTPAAPAAPPPAAPAAPPIPGQPRPAPRKGAAGRPGRANSERVGYDDDEFAFVDDEAEESEDVIDWLKFAETRSERRDERRKQLRGRAIALLLALVLAGVGVGGYFAYTTWFKGDGKAAQQASGGAVLIQLRGKDGQALASAVLANDPTRGTASMMTVPSVTIVNTPSAGPVPLGSLMASDGAGASREALAQLIGIKMDGSWVVSEPVLQGLVDMVGGIELDADVEVKGPDGQVLVPRGKSNVRGAAARAYAAYRVPGEAPGLGSDRFGRVVNGVLRGLPQKPDLVASLLRNLANVSDPSLPDARLADLLTEMAKGVQTQKFTSAGLPVQPDGMLDTAAAGTVVKNILGGTVTVPRAEGPARVMVGDASGKNNAAESVRVKMVNAGYTFVPGGPVDAKAKPTTIIQYSDDARLETAKQIALTLNLPETAVTKAQGQMLADIVITLGQDYKP